MAILIAILSIYLFTGLVYLARKNFSINICPICVGVSATWMWMLLGIIFKVIPNSFIFPTGILIALSILGIVNKLKNKQYKFWEPPRTPNTPRVGELEEKMKDCC